MHLALALVLGLSWASASSDCVDGRGQPVVRVAADEASGTDVVEFNDIRFLRAGRSIIGAQFIAPEMADQTAFTAFVVMQAACFIRLVDDEHPDQELAASQSFLQIGLGIGAVPRFMKDQCGVPVVNVVEYSPTVSDYARNHFGYAAGSIVNVDGFAFLEHHAHNDTVVTTGGYDVVMQDVYMGWNPTHMINEEIFDMVKRKWLNPGRGVYIMNHVGYLFDDDNGSNKFSVRVVDTLREVFQFVECYSDVPPWDIMEGNTPTNIICFASDREFFFDMPTYPEDQELIMHSAPWIYSNMLNWQVFPPRTDQDLDVCYINHPVASKITKSTDLTEFQAIFDSVQEKMWQQVQGILPRCSWLQGVLGDNDQV